MAFERKIDDKTREWMTDQAQCTVGKLSHVVCEASEMKEDREGREGITKDADMDAVVWEGYRFDVCLDFPKKKLVNKWNQLHTYLRNEEAFASMF